MTSTDRDDMGFGNNSEFLSDTFIFIYGSQKYNLHLVFTAREFVSYTKKKEKQSRNVTI